MTDTLDILVIGESLIELSTDKKLTYAETFNKYFGSDVLNTAISASRLGSKVGFITKIGNDSFKDFLLDSWQSEKLDISQVKIVEGYNGVYMVSKPPGEEKEICYYRKKSAATTLSIEDIAEEEIARSSIVYATGISQSLSASANGAVKKAFTLAGKNKCLVAYDPNFRENITELEEAKAALEVIIDHIDILILSSEHDAVKLIDINSADKIIKYFWDRGVPTVAVKQGETGCSIGHNGEITFIPARKVDIFDSTGAGDTFNGAFLYGIAKGYTPFEAARIATIAASEQAKSWGAIKSIPYKEQVFAEYKKVE